MVYIANFLIYGSRRFVIRPVCVASKKCNAFFVMITQTENRYDRLPIMEQVDKILYESKSV